MRRAELEAILGASATEQLFGFELKQHSDEHVTLGLAVQARFLQGAGVVHGGVLATLADSAAVLALFPRATDSAQGLASVEFKLNFLRPALPSAGDLVATARVLQRGSRLGVCEVDVEQAGRTVAKGLFTYMYLAREELVRSPNPPLSTQANPLETP